ncbi:cephalotocin receptor 1-like isoform X2 [Tubulanus polymorphus]|uniref:cephalotocin receptor 1-like isoform X2 n=1 Tax=Tubulanus polymorphus TaxID=672921 RepID=UPI003DA1E03C
MTDTSARLPEQHTSAPGIFRSTTEYTNNSANGTDPIPRSQFLANLEIAVQAVIFFLAVVGNSIVLIVLFLRKKKFSRMHLFIAHLSFADLFVAFFNVLPQMCWDITYRFQGNNAFCKFVKYVQLVAIYASSYVLVMTAIDRYLAICYPLTTHTWTSFRTNLMVTIMIGIAWGLALLFSLPQVFIFSLTDVGNGVYDCWAHFDPEWTIPLYITSFSFAVYFIPFIILVFTYGRICLIVWNSMGKREVVPPTPVSIQSQMSRSYSGQCEERLLRRRNDASNPRAHSRSMSNAKVKTVKLTLTVIICFLVCWGPFFISQLWAAWDENAPFTEPGMAIVMLLASLNSCTNPWIYMVYADTLCLQRPPKYRHNSSIISANAINNCRQHDDNPGVIGKPQ